MTNGPTCSVRPANPGDEPALRDFGAADLIPRIGPGEVLVCLDAGAQIVAAAGVRPSGGPPGEGDAQPGTGSIEPVHVRPGVERHAHGAVEALISACEHRLAARGIARWVLSLDATAHTPIRAAEALGYRPTGRGPYRPLGPGAVEYLHGYTGPEGYLVDFEH